MEARSSASVAFSLAVPGTGMSVAVTVRCFGERWLAEVDLGTSRELALGPTGGEALKRALAPLGRAAVVLMMADLALLGPSCELLTGAVGAG